MLIIDGDYPMALAVRMNRDLKLPIDEVRNAHAGGVIGVWTDSNGLVFIVVESIFRVVRFSNLYRSAS